MTVINRNLNHTVPSIGSDLLITVVATDQVFVPPAFESLPAEFITRLPYKPVGLAQKIYVLADTVCIALAGRVMEMKQLVDDLSMFCRITPRLTGESIRTYLRDYGLDQLKECAFVMLVVERSSEGDFDVTEITMGEFTEVDTEMFDQAAAIGSGAQDYLDVINQKMKFFTSFPKGGIRQSVVKEGTLIAHLLVWERATRKTLEKAWGGAFEFCVFDGRKFVKPDNVAYIVNFGQVDANGRYEMPFPVFVLHHRYVGEHLVITKVFWKNHHFSDDGVDRYILRSTDVTAQVFIVPSIKTGAFVPPELQKVESFETGWIGMGYLVNTHDQLSVMPAFFTASSDLNVVFDAEKGVVELFMRKTVTELIQQLMTEAVAATRAAGPEPE